MLPSSVVLISFVLLLVVTLVYITILSSTFSSLCLLPQSLYSISPSHFSIFPFSLVNLFTASFFLFQGAGGGTVVTVSVAEPDVDSDGSVYDVAEISQVIILYSRLSSPRFRSVSIPFYFSIFPSIHLSLSHSLSLPLASFSGLIKKQLKFKSRRVTWR